MASAQTPPSVSSSALHVPLCLEGKQLLGLAVVQVRRLAEFHALQRRLQEERVHEEHAVAAREFGEVPHHASQNTRRSSNVARVFGPVTHGWFSTLS